MNHVAVLKAIDRFYDRITKAVDKNDWRRIQIIADRNLTAVQRAFLRAIATLQGTIVLRYIVDGLENEKEEQVIEAIDWETFAAALSSDAREVITRILFDAAKVEVENLRRMNAEYQLRFDMRNSRAEKWIEEHTADLVTQVTDETRHAIRDIIHDAFEHGGHPYETAQKIREYVGLTRRDATAVLNYRRKLEEKGTDPAAADRWASQYADRLLRRRAENISRTETIMAANAGQHAVWDEAVADGVIDPKRWRKEWIVTNDDRLCPICAAMRGEKVKLDEAFSAGVPHPPAHPSCRCAQGLTEVRQ